MFVHNVIAGLWRVVAHQLTGLGRDATLRRPFLARLLSLFLGLLDRIPVDPLWMYTTKVLMFWRFSNILWIYCIIPILTNCTDETILIVLEGTWPHPQNSCHTAFSVVIWRARVLGVRIVWLPFPVFLILILLLHFHLLSFLDQLLYFLSCVTVSLFPDWKDVLISISIAHCVPAGFEHISTTFQLSFLSVSRINFVFLTLLTHRHLHTLFSCLWRQKTRL